jgi:CHAT domain-containing protein
MARRANTIASTIYGDQSTKIAAALLGLADVYISIGDFDQAAQFLTRAIDIQTKRFGAQHVDVGKSTSQLALVNFYQGKPITDVQKQFGVAEKIIGASLGSNNPTYAEILKNMAVANIAAGNYSLANQYLDDAAKIWSQKIGKRNNVNIATVALLKGDINYRQANYAQAEGFYNDALKQYGKVFSDAHPEYVKVQAKLSRTYYMQGDYKRSQDQLEAVLAKYKVFIQDYFPALSEREKAKFWNTIKPHYEFYNTLIVSRNRTSKYLGEMYNNALLTKALLLNSSIKIRQRIMNSNDQELIDMYTGWVEKKEILTAALSMNADQLNENGISPMVLTAEVEALEKKLSARSEDFGQGVDSDPITWENVRDALKENEVAMEMVRFRYFNQDFTDSIVYAVLYVKGGKRSEPELILLNNGKDLESKFLKNFRNRIKFKLADDLSYDQFWKPITDKVGTVSTVYLSPDGVYNQINLEAIATPDGRYVLDNSNIVLLSNTKDLYLAKQKAKVAITNQVAMMFGNPQFYVKTSRGVPKVNSGLTRSSVEVISDLPGTKAELEELEDLLNRKGWTVDAKTELAADEPSIKSISNPRIFHVATHGFFQDSKKVASAKDELNEASTFDNPLLKTGLLLAGAGDILNETKYNYNIDNGILTAYEAMNLNLDQTDLVVLSACETGLGELEAGEGVYGLQRAFLVAGARTIIMSLFKVSDEATQQLMVKFYRKWIETGDKRQAFIDAKKEIRNEYKDPIYWGPFIMIGLD